MSDADCPGDMICQNGNCVAPPDTGNGDGDGEGIDRRLIIGGAAVAGLAGVGLLWATSDDDNNRRRRR